MGTEDKIGNKVEDIKGKVKESTGKEIGRAHV